MLLGMCCGAGARCASYDAHLAPDDLTRSKRAGVFWSVLKCFKCVLCEIYVHSLVDKLK